MTIKSQVNVGPMRQWAAAVGASRPRFAHVIRQRGFTMVELLVATTVTLLLIFALAQAFAVVSVSLSLNRATVEMAGQLRGVAFRLQQDLEGHTAPTKPWLSSSSAEGYFEYFDGSSSDLDWNANGTIDALEVTNSDTSVGDIDDVLMFTSKSSEIPFLGQLGNLRVQSQFAEIAWWLSYDDRDVDMVRDFNEPLTLFRRCLLVRPDLNKLDTAAPANAPSRYFARLPSAANQFYNTSTDLPLMVAAVLSFYNDYDLSVHFARYEPPGGGVALYAVANSLSDLTLRQNRFCHDPIVYRKPPGSATYTYLGNSSLPNTVFPMDSYHPFPLNRDYITVHANAGVGVIQPSITLRSIIRPSTSLRYGEEVMLPNALGFDVRAYDDNALVSAHVGADGGWGVAGVNDDGGGGTDDVGEALWKGSDDEAVAPGDWGYGAGGNVNIATAPPYPAARNIVPCSRGAYVDLAFYNKLQILGYPTPTYAPALFGPGTDVKSKLYGATNAAKMSLYDSGTWDTYPLDLENDGVNQDGDALTDEGTNSVDDDQINGVDDDGEKETGPPYNTDLTGLQIRIRMLETDTRQVRQTSVISRFNVD